MSNTIDFKLPWQKAYIEWRKTAGQDHDMDSMFKAGYYAGLQDKENQVIKRLDDLVRGKKVDFP